VESTICSVVLHSEPMRTKMKLIWSFRLNFIWQGIKYSEGGTDFSPQEFLVVQMQNRRLNLMFIGQCIILIVE